MMKKNVYLRGNWTSCRQLSNKNKTKTIKKEEEIKPAKQTKQSP